MKYLVKMEKGFLVNFNINDLFLIMFFSKSNNAWVSIFECQTLTGCLAAGIFRKIMSTQQLTILLERNLRLLLFFYVYIFSGLTINEEIEFKNSIKILASSFPSFFIPLYSLKQNLSHLIIPAFPFCNLSYCSYNLAEKIPCKNKRP